MAKKGTPNRSVSPIRSTNGSDLSSEFTGKFLVLFRNDAVDQGMRKINDLCGLSDVCKSSDFLSSAVDMEQANSAQVVLFDRIAVAVVDADPGQLNTLQEVASANESILAVEPERYLYALNNLSLDYLRGYRDAVNHVYDSLSGAGQVGTELHSTTASSFSDNTQVTWGLQATLVNQSRYSGSGVRVAILDTGFDLDHPDFIGRTITSQSFIQGQAVQDNNGHGTHCAGTALGSKAPSSGVRRYGCAFNGEIYIGKVLSDAGSGADRGILAGINWAIANKCRIISMSLGSRTLPGDTFSQVYEQIASTALSGSPGTLIVAAAGNDSRNPNTGARLDPPAPVGRPANCPSIMAVASLTSDLQVSPFSNGAINGNGGEVNIAGPGSAVFSSVPDPFPASIQPSSRVVPWPPKHHSISGTSMATPHVAGIAAMWLESNPTTDAKALWQLLVTNAKSLSLPKRDVGAGLVQAPIT